MCEYCGNHGIRGGEYCTCVRGIEERVKFLKQRMVSTSGKHLDTSCGQYRITCKDELRKKDGA